MSSHLLNVEVTNFGPIQQGQIELRPLTLLIGPNNSGKSYFAQLLYGLCSLVSAEWPQRPRRVSPFREYLAGSNGLAEHAYLRELSPKEFEVCRTALSSFEENVVQRLTWLLPQYFGGRRLDQMRNTQAAKSSAKVTVNQSHNGPHTLRFEFKLRPKVPRVHRPDISGLQVARQALDLYESTSDPALASFVLGKNLWAQLLAESGFPTGESYYMPAGRSGLISGARTVNSYVFSTIRQNLGRQPIDFPALSGVVGDFFQDYLDTAPPTASTLPGPKSELMSAREFLRKELLQGRIMYKEFGFQPPMLMYEGRHVQLPLESTSSMIQELAPLDLWIERYLRPGDVVLIDEPEAHLHPSHQRLVARLLVRLTNAGVFIVAPTHSSWILNQVSNCMLAESASQSVVTELGLEEADRISRESVGVYLFAQEAHGTVVRQIPIDPDTGIPEDEFLRVAEAIGEEGYQLSVDSMENGLVRATA